MLLNHLEAKENSVEFHAMVKQGLKFRRGIQEALNEKARVKEAWLHKDSEHKGISPAAGYQVKKTLWWEQFCVTILEA